MFRQTFFTALTAFLFTVSAFAQISVNGDPEVLIKQEGQYFQAPVWSPNGETIAFSGNRYVGIWMADANGSNIRQLTEADAGYGFSWSNDSQAILTRVNEFQNRRRSHAVTIFKADGSEPNQISEFRPTMEALPQWAQYGEKVVLIQNESIETFDSGIEIPQRFKTQPAKPFYVLKNNSIAKGMIPTNSTENISPFEDAQYLNLEISPDGQKLAFEVYGGNLYVMNVDGSNLIDLGKANRPSWSPDSQYIVASVSEDNGYNITKGDIYAFGTDGSTQINLTSGSDLIAQNPNWSPDGSKIAFDVPDQGAIYILNIQQ